MMSSSGFIFIRLKIILLFLLLLIQGKGFSQVSVLDSLSSFRNGIVKTSEALDLITKQTGYKFSYDSRLINAERNTDLSYDTITLRSVLENITGNDSLEFSVIDKFIIISRKSSKGSLETGGPDDSDTGYFTGTVKDKETGGSQSALRFVFGSKFSAVLACAVPFGSSTRNAAVPLPVWPNLKAASAP